jgi:hypothetical protein
MVVSMRTPLMRLARSSMLGFDSSHVPESHTGHFPPATRRDEIDAQNFIFLKKIYGTILL